MVCNAQHKSRIKVSTAPTSSKRGIYSFWRINLDFFYLSFVLPKSLFLFLKKYLRILHLSKRSFLEVAVPILRSFIELHIHYKILILEPIKGKFNHTKRIIHKGVSNEDLMHWILKQLVIQLRSSICFTKITMSTMLFLVLLNLNWYFSIYSHLPQINKTVI